MAIDKTVLQAALAGLVHDLGKVAQRSRDDPWQPPGGERLEGQPVHAAWTLDFIRRVVPSAYRPAADHGAYHHRPQASPSADAGVSYLVALADKLSAGERADPLPQKGAAPPMQMVTVFDRIAREGEPRTEGWHYLPLEPISLREEALFPNPEPLAAEDARRAYRELLEQLEEAASFDPGDEETYLENLLWAMQRLLWCVPSAYYNNLPDISLYDHSRMTAALAVCMAQWPPDRVVDLLQAVEQEFQGQGSSPALDQEVALLIGGDLSGIQDFLYTLSSRRAAATLRGRSFYLELLTEAVLRFVMRALGLPATNIIYSGGGHFFLLAPAEAGERLETLRKQISERMLAHHGTELYLSLAWTPVPARGLRRGAFPQYWGRMHAELARVKTRRYLELGPDLYPRLFQPPAEGGNPEETCSVCGGDARPVEPFVDDDEAQARLCSLCRSFHEDLGRRLPQALFLALGFSSPEPAPAGTALDALRAFGMQVQLLRAGEGVDLPGAERVLIRAFSDSTSWPNGDGAPAAHGVRYTVNRVPPMDFNALQEEVAGGFKRLGVLRMDVDDLGDIFTRGLGEGERSRATLARLATLSLQMSLFFEGWVKHLTEIEPWKDLVYAVYSGGDDVFLIGPWDRMPGLGLRIRRDFQAYTGGHPDLHLSGGMAFIGGKYPVYQAAEDAGEALDKAKSVEGKNAFCFLDQALPWHDFETLVQWKDELVHLVSAEESAARGVLQTLRQMAAQAEEARGPRGRPLWGPWMWRGAYLLTRTAERAPEKAKESMLAIRDRLESDNYAHLPDMGLAARWAQLETRKQRPKQPASAGTDRREGGNE